MRIHLLAALFVGTLALAQTDPGRREYEARCSRCHGADATGGESGPNIQAQIAARSATELAAFLRVGRPAAGMPAFDLPTEDMTNLVAHLRTLAPMSRTAPSAVVRKKIQTTTGETLEGQVLNQGPLDLQLRTDDKQIHLLRKTGDRYRPVTSQTDWPTYNGDPSGNRYTHAFGDQQGQRPQPRSALDLSNAECLADREHSRGGRRHYVCVERQRMLGARRGQRPPDLALSARAHQGRRGQRGHRIQSRRGVERRSHLHAHRQCAPDRDEPLQRRAAVGHRDGGLAFELQRHLRAAGGRQSRHLGHGRRR